MGHPSAQLWFKPLYDLCAKASCRKVAMRSRSEPFRVYASDIQVWARVSWISPNLTCCSADLALQVGQALNDFAEYIFLLFEHDIAWKSAKLT